MTECHCQVRVRKPSYPQLPATSVSSSGRVFRPLSVCFLTDLLHNILEALSQKCLESVKLSPRKAPANCLCILFPSHLSCSSIQTLQSQCCYDEIPWYGYFTTEVYFGSQFWSPNQAPALDKGLELCPSLVSDITHTRTKERYQAS